MIIITYYSKKSCPVCIDFFKEWKKLNNIKTNDIILNKINIDGKNQFYENEEIINSYPSIFIKINKKVYEYNGIKKAENIMNFITNFKLGNEYFHEINYQYKYIKYKKKYLKKKIDNYNIHNNKFVI